MREEKKEYYINQFKKIKSIYEVENEDMFFKIACELIRINVEIQCAGYNIPADIERRLFYAEFNELKSEIEKIYRE